MVKKYFNGAYEGELKIFDVLQTELQEVPFDASESRDLKKLMKIFFLGQLVGLPTLHSLLRKHGIRSNNHQINYKHLCNRLTISTIRKVFEGIFEAQILDVLKKMSEKDSSCWSRELVTALVDDSIFKQWHNQQDPSKDFEDCFGKFFSGQFMASVYGFKVVTFALSIDGIVYPLYFDYVKKATDNNPKPLKASQVAEKLVRKWGLFVKKAQEKGISLPKLHFSCDNGYSDVPLCETCSDNSLIYISVPKKSHLFEIHQKEGAIKKMNLDNWIKDVFLDAEKKHLEAQIALPKDKKTAFTYRFRAHYLAQNREVTLLVFRLNGSKKVSVIYCTDKNIFAKTLRKALVSKNLYRAIL